MPKRKLSAETVKGEPLPEEPERARSGMGGMWGGTALNMVRRRLEESREALLDGVLSGTVIVEVDPEDIEDAIGSDRETGWQGDAEMGDLVENIRRRGQTQPVRLRPAGEDWKPDPERPMSPRGPYVVQSGRRRIEACRRLGRPVRAVISTDIGDARLSDLEERFHENTQRRALSGFEELLSIGVIAETLPDLSQTEIADRLSVTQADVSLGRACIEFRTELESLPEVSRLSKREFRTMIPKLRADKGEGRGRRAATGGIGGRADWTVLEDQGVRIELHPRRGGFDLKVRGPKDGELAAKILLLHYMEAEEAI